MTTQMTTYGLYPDMEYTAFLDRMRDRARRSNRVIERNRWVEPIPLTLQKTYDQETEQALASIHDNERRSA